PVVVDVVIVEDHRGRDDGKQPAHRRLAPRLAVELAVLGEVGDLVARAGVCGVRGRRVAALLDEPACRRSRVVSVDLVPYEQKDVGPAVRWRGAQLRGAAGERVGTVS